jgi:hypothetical protein
VTTMTDEELSQMVDDLIVAILHVQWSGRDAIGNEIFNFLRYRIDSKPEANGLRAALTKIVKGPPSTLDEPDTDAEVIRKMRAIAKEALGAVGCVEQHGKD